ncbi:MAG: MFS transporter [Thermoplasmataceae archaeon]
MNKINRQQWTRIFAAWSGWMMDGYVTISYAIVAPVVIASEILPPGGLAFLSPLASALLGLAVNAIARSVGSLVFGNFLGDRIGRRMMLTVTVMGFSLLSFLLGWLPTYSSYGITATVLLYVILFVMGLFAGAEYGGGAALATESVSPEDRGFVGAFVQSGFGVGYFLVSLVYSLFVFKLGTTGFVSVGWRYLFFTSLIPAAIAVATRFGSTDSPVFEEMKSQSEVERVPFIKMFTQAPKSVLIAILITTGLLYINSGTLSFFPTVFDTMKIAGSSTGLLLAAINFISLLGVWIGGALMRFIPGRRLSMFLYSIIFLFLFAPLLILGSSHDTLSIIVGFGMVSFLEAMVFAALPSFLSETFSKRYRATAVGMTYNAGAIIGGFAPTIIVSMEFLGGITTAWILNIAIASFAMLGGIIVSTETWHHENGKGHDAIAH